MSRPSRVRATGPLAPFAAGFRQELAQQGYTAHSASNQLQLMAHASRWLANSGLGLEALSPSRVEEFLAHRRAEGYTLWLSAKAMIPMLDYLRGIGVAPTPAPAVPATEAEQLEERYRVYLVEERGLAAGTIAGYLHVARHAALRHPEHAALIQRVLAIPAKRTDRQLVSFLTGDEIDALLAAPDRATWAGRRDHALLLVAVQTGLRVSELTVLTCEDVELGVGAHVRCHGKGRKERITPLTKQACGVLRVWLAERQGQPCDPLFPTRTKLRRGSWWPVRVTMREIRKAPLMYGGVR